MLGKISEMKRFGSVGIFMVIVSFFLQSCISGKDWVCECRDGSFTSKYLITNQPKSDAEKMCNYIKVDEEYESCTVTEL